MGRFVHILSSRIFLELQIVNVFSHIIFFLGFALFYLTENEKIKNSFFVKSYYFVIFIISLLYIYGTRNNGFIVTNVFIPLGKIIFAFLFIELILYLLEFINNKKSKAKGEKISE